MTNKINAVFILISAALFSDNISAQQTPVFSSYNYNTVLINPAHAGYYENGDLVLTANGYFNSVEGSPRNADFTFNTPSNSEKMGLAGGIAHNQIGVTYTTNFFASYSYKIFFDDYNQGRWWSYNPNVVSFGITAGAQLYNENLTKLGIDNDPEFQENIDSFTPTLGIGFLYSRNRIYLGLSAPNVLSSTFNNKNNTNLKNVYYGYFGYRLFTDRFEDIVITPSFMAKYIEGAPFQADLNLLINYKNKIELGGGYRTSNHLNLLAGFHMGRNSRLIFTYSKSMEKIVLPDTFGLVLNYRFGNGFE
ncbi:PorP/SprF family type IX secretion system membrane protein [Flavobacterium foetidum]|uniref:PorP/SprF family type IX secretion system membrane protein n=1 Tax=Flavobacterium foetidum TaxID=2026681 RepID=UPI001074E6B7|nr:PorP/SprF family type IX secretion system membrane protein [Flavobacterium foetidum]KAF2515223.1 type IX secretion system membrane protein PorP/SprF [Flavobacterium foetidum]